ncbi:MAG: O-antigen ligase family protein [Acidobacteriia bacterium]|nr:O-antigen ligase family protein [Terriglobia bacterium]
MPRWRPTATVLLPVACGVLAAIAIALQSWPALAVLLGISVALVVPVEFAFGLLALAVPFDTVTTLGSSGLTLSFAVSAASGGILLAKILAGGRVAAPPRALPWFVLFFLWAAMSTLWALDPSLSTKRLPAAAALTALYVVAVILQITERELRTVGQMIVFGGTVAAAVSLYQFAMGVNVAGRASIVFGAVATNSNELAASLILPVSLAVGGVLSSRGWRRGLAVAAVVLMLLCTLLTMSRGGLVALAAMAAVYFYRQGTDKRLIAVLACATALILVAPDLLMTRMQEALSSRAQGRLDIWLVGMEVVKHYGAFGVGLDNFPLAFQQYAGRQMVFRAFSTVPHNIYLQAIAETGLLGFFLLIGALRAQMKDIARTIRGARDSATAWIVPYEAAAWGIIIQGMVANLLWRKMFWLVWIVVALAVQVAKRNTGTHAETLNAG